MFVVVPLSCCLTFAILNLLLILLLCPAYHAWCSSYSNWPSAEDVLMASNENKCKLWSFEKVVTDEDLRLAHNVQVSELAGQKVGGECHFHLFFRVGG